MSSRISVDRPGGAADFDFLWGSWNVHHRRLAQRLAGSTDWAEFGGTMQARPILGGLGNFDENSLWMPDGHYEASTLRYFDLASRKWHIVWIDGRNPELGIPMVGAFADGLGTFFADETFEGRPIRVRFLWSETKTKSPRWEQAFSEDGGESWETNWIMQFEKAS